MASETMGSAAAAMFTLSIVLTALLSSAFTVILNIVVTALKTPKIAGFAMGFTNLFAGLVIPLALFPDWMQGALLWQPFAGLADIPYRIYSGALVGPRAFEGIAAQTLWIVLIALIGRWWLDRVMARIDMQGS